MIWLVLSPRVVGRDRELAAVAAAVHGDGAPGAVGVLGDAGMGKSALLRAASSRGSRMTLHAGAVPGAAPLDVLSEIAVAAVVAGADPKHPSLDSLRSGIAPLLSAEAAADHLIGAALPKLIAEALVALIATLESDAVCVIDDLHWADPASLAACERLCVRTRGRRSLSFLLAARPGSAAEDMFRRLTASRYLELVELGPLADTDVVLMAEACLGASAPSEVIDLLRGCDGWPYFIEELLTTAVSTGVLQRGRQGWVMEADRVPPVPRGVLDALTRRADDLPAGARRLVTAAAVLGDGVPAEIVAAAADLSHSELEGALRAGRAAQFLTDSDQNQITFRHALAAEALAAATNAPERRVLASRALAHLATSDAASGRGPASTALRARLAEQAGDREDAARWRLELARTLAAQAVVGPALEQYDHALALAASPELRSTARHERVELLVLTGRLEEARAELDAVDAYEAHDPARRASTAILRAQAAAADTATSRRWATDAGTSATNPRQRGHVLAVSAVLEIERGELSAAETLARDALATPDIDPVTRCQALETLGRVSRTRSLDDAARSFRQSEAIAHAHGLGLWRARALHELATIRQLRHLDTVDLYVARAAAVACGSTGLLASIDFHIAAVLATAFDGRAALPVARRCVDLARVIDDPAQEAYGWMLCGYAHLVSGERPSAIAALAESDRRNPGVDELATLNTFLRSGLASLLDGDPDRAACSYLDAMVQLAEQRTTVSPLPPWYLGPVLLTVLDHDRAAAARTLADRDELNPVLACHPSLDLARAVDAGRRGDIEAACALSASAFDAWGDKPGADGLRHLASWLIADPAARAGWGDPVRWLFDAESWAIEQNLPALAENCRSRLRQLGATPRRRRGRTPVPPALRRLGVTSREIDVLTLLTGGLSNAALAERLHIAPGTVKGYVESLLCKTQSANRAALASLAAEHRLARDAATLNEPDGGSREP